MKGSELLGSMMPHNLSSCLSGSGTMTSIVGANIKVFLSSAQKNAPAQFTQAQIEKGGVKNNQPPFSTKMHLAANEKMLEN